MSTRIGPNSLVTLHYRIGLADGRPMVSTFEGTPATLQLGADELLPQLEQLLTGLEAGAETGFDLAPEDAFGPHRAELIERVQRKHLPEAEIEIPSVLEFTAPDGSRYSGVATHAADNAVTIDFNHPLAGKCVRFDVRIIGVL